MVIPDKPFDLPGYYIKRLHSNELAEVQLLLEKCADYLLLVDGEPPSPTIAVSLFTERPEGKTTDDIIVLGVYTEKLGLIGMLSAVQDYPDMQEWWIGLLLLDPAYRSMGIGAQIYQSFQKWLEELGARSIYLGVVEDNFKAYQFWSRQGFKEIRRQSDLQFGRVSHTVITMRRDLVCKA